MVDGAKGHLSWQQNYKANALGIQLICIIEVFILELDLSLIVNYSKYYPLL